MQVETSTVILGAFALVTSAITVAGAFFAPIFQSRARTREKKEEFELARLQKQEDYARQDKVAADLLRRQDEIAAKENSHETRRLKSSNKGPFGGLMFYSPCNAFTLASRAATRASRLGWGGGAGEGAGVATGFPDACSAA